MSESVVIRPLEKPLRGSIRVPGDKSISHRAVLLSAMAEGTSQIRGVLDSDDVRSSIRVIQQLGAQVNLQIMPDGSLEGAITGWGAKGPSQPDAPLDCGNSGTTARLLMGILAPWGIEAELTGDESLARRPMQRVMTPLSRMGARFFPQDAQTLPIIERGTGHLDPITYETPVASAQLKTAVLLAGLSADGETRVIEPAPSRNHTELMLPAFGAETTAATRVASVKGPVTLRATDVVVPGDPSSAAFLLCAAALCPGSAIQVEGVSLNPARIGFLRTLEHMGVNASRRSDGAKGKELSGILSVECCDRLHGCEVPAEKIATVIDEVPILALVAAHAKGVTVFRGADELRVKETDRAAAVIEGLALMGIDAWMDGSDLFIEGDPMLSTPAGLRFDAKGDHRLAMTWAVAGLCGANPIEIQGFDAVSVSYPGFLDDIRMLAR